MSNLAEKLLLKTLRSYRQALKLDEEIKAHDQIMGFLEGTPWPDCFHRSWLSGHITGSAFIVSLDLKSTLLTHHRKLDAWLQLGGHSDGNPKTWEVALREAQEESGLRDFRWDPALFLDLGEEKIPLPFDVDTHRIPARGHEPEHIHYDIRYLLFADCQKELIVSSESHSLAWVPLREIGRYTQERSILRMVEKITLRSA